MIVDVKSAAPDLPLEFHGHNDLGMATANTIAAFEAGCQCASVTINGLGERAGNAPLAEVVMALKVALKCDCGFRYRDLSSLSDLVAEITRRRKSPSSGPPLSATNPAFTAAACWPISAPMRRSARKTADTRLLNL
jgi:homocitrate synthase NifV